MSSISVYIRLFISQFTSLNEVSPRESRTVVSMAEYGEVVEGGDGDRLITSTLLDRLQSSLNLISHFLSTNSSILSITSTNR